MILGLKLIVRDRNYNYNNLETFIIVIKKTFTLNDKTINVK